MNRVKIWVSRNPPLYLFADKAALHIVLLLSLLNRRIGFNRKQNNKIIIYCNRKR